MANTWGSLFRVTTFGESHGGGLGCVIDGCPPGVRLDLGRVQSELDRRRPGQSALTTTRCESDQVELLSGLFEGRTLGTPLALLVRNRDADPSAYEAMKDIYRPSHADFSTEAKYGLRAWAGGGRASARETVARVAAGAVARQVLQTLHSIEVIAWVDRVYDVSASVDPDAVNSAQVDANSVRCPDPVAASRMAERIEEARNAGDSVGGVIRCVARGVPAGLGEPVFDKLEADLAKAMLSIPAARGFEIGSGFTGAQMRGSVHNDAFEADGRGAVRTVTNHSGGVQGGISNGMPIVFSVAFKPVSTISSIQQTVNVRGEAVSLEASGRHDPCVLPRAVPIVEAMTWLTLVDHALRWRAQGRAHD